MKKRLLFILGGLLIIIAGLAALITWFISTGLKQDVSMEEPVDVVSDFYSPWLEAVQATSTDPYIEEQHKNPILSKELRKKLKELKPEAEGDMDPVLCQTVIPEKIATRIVFQTEEQAQLLITGRKTESTSQAIVSLNKLNDGWYINDIECSLGEFAPDREFTFEREGALLKDSIIAPFNPEYWHIIFEEDGVKGNAAPLFFSEQSECTRDGNTSVCDTSQLQETMNVIVKGEMSERGVDVKKLEILK